ncbi:MAG: YqeG family HAD IIIA-type phosphatase [Oscillospiraceae bacterium]|nr:YqeG family HAD IIIA-type phosphatase [Oscillospiraceae bacterium]
MFLPKYIFKNLTDISPDFLRDRGIEVLLLDFDNTMLPYTRNEPTAELLAWIQGMKAADIGLCIVSNSKKDRVPLFCRRYGLSYVTHANKPGTRGIRQAVEKMGGKPSALVGDQIYTDVLGANRAGLVSILVNAIDNHNIWLKLRHVLELPFISISAKRRITS